VTVTAVDDLGRSVVSGPLSVTIVAATPPPPAPGQNDCNTGFDAGNTLATATPITLPVTCTGTKPAGDVDVYAITATQPFQLLSVSVTGFFAGLDLYDPAGSVRLSTGLPFSGPTWVDICPTTPCQNNVTGRAFGFTVDMVGTWLLVVRDDVPALPANASYTLSAAFGGGGSDCLTGRDPALVPPTVTDAPNEGPYTMTLLKRDVACTGSLPPTDFDTGDRYDFAVVAGEPVAAAVVPALPTPPALGELQRPLIFRTHRRPPTRGGGLTHHGGPGRARRERQRSPDREWTSKRRTAAASSQLWPVRGDRLEPHERLLHRPGRAGIIRPRRADARACVYRHGQRD